MVPRHALFLRGGFAVLAIREEIIIAASTLGVLLCICECGVFGVPVSLRVIVRCALRSTAFSPRKRKEAKANIANYSCIARACVCVLFGSVCFFLIVCMCERFARV